MRLKLLVPAVKFAIFCGFSNEKRNSWDFFSFWSIVQDSWSCMVFSLTSSPFFTPSPTTLAKKGGRRIERQRGTDTPRQIQRNYFIFSGFCWRDFDLTRSVHRLREKHPLLKASSLLSPLHCQCGLLVLAHQSARLGASQRAVLFRFFSGEEKKKEQEKLGGVQPE